MGSSKNAVDLLRFENRKRKRKKRKMCITYKKFCGCCCNIVRGALILAVFELIFYALVLLCALTPLSINYFKHSYYYDDIDEEFKVRLPTAGLIYIISIILNVIFLITTALKLYGLVKRRPGYILPWMVINMICLVLSIIAIVCILVLFCIAYLDFNEFMDSIGDLDFFESMESIGVVFIPYGLAFAFFFYIWDVVKSAYKQIKEENESNQLTYPNQMPMKTSFEQTPPKYNNQVVYTVQPV